MKLITKQLSNKLPPDHPLIKNKTINPNNADQLITILSGLNKIEIYDLTQTKQCPNFYQVNVKDHINRTGHNPLINKQKIINKDFIDITKLYQHKNKSIITNCCGKKLDLQYEYPSHYLCHVTILAKALDVTNIYAFLINVL